MFWLVTRCRDGHPDILNTSPRDHLLTSAPPPSFHYQASLLNPVKLRGKQRKGGGRVSGQRAAFVYQPQKQHGRSKCHITTRCSFKSVGLSADRGSPPLATERPPGPLHSEKTNTLLLLLSKRTKTTRLGRARRLLDMLQIEQSLIH